MKVLFATMQYGRGYAQGTERYLEMLIAGLRRRGHAATVLAGDPEQRDPAKLGLGAPVGPDAQAAPVLHYPAYGWATVRGLSDAELAAVLDREQPDIVHLANPGHIGVGLVDAARARGTPVAITVMDHWWACPKHSLWHYRGRICVGDVSWRECLRCIATEDERPAVRALARAPVVRGLALPLLYGRAARRRGAPWRELRDWPRRRTVLDKALRAADAVIFLSDGALRRLGTNLEPARVHQIVVGLEPRWFEHPTKPDPAQFAPSASPLELAAQAPASAVPVRQLRTDSPEPTLGFVGALAEHKGPHLLLEALRRLGWTRVRVRLAGGAAAPAYQARLRRLAAGLNVEFLGRVPSTDVPALLRTLNLLVVPSIGAENLPQIVLEAHAVGVPVMASRVDGLLEAIADPDLLFEVNSPVSLAERLRTWAQREAAPFEQHAARATQTRIARPAWRPPTCDQMVERTLAVYTAILPPPRK